MAKEGRCDEVVNGRLKSLWGLLFGFLSLCGAQSFSDCPWVSCASHLVLWELGLSGCFCNLLVLGRLFHINRKMYKGASYKVNDQNVVHFYFEKPGFPSGNFKQILSKYVNGLLNTKGGVLVFGVDPQTCKVVGCNINSREQEDLYKLEVDREIRGMRPTVSPSLCRFAITRLDDAPLFVMEIKIGAGPIGEMFMNISEEVYVIRKRNLFGPLIPQEIKDLVIAKYREEVASSASLLSPVASRTPASQVEDGEIEN